MITEKTIDSLSKKYSLSSQDFIKHASTLSLREKKRNLQIERIEILARYEAETVTDLEDKIKKGAIPEHPTWEDMIEIKNIEAEIKEIEDDIRTLQAA